MTYEPSLLDLLRHAQPPFDAAWYAGLYHEASQGVIDPETHFLTVGQRLGRGSCAIQPELDPDSGLAQALARRQVEARDPERIVLSYCIPVMNRLDDLQLTLAENLSANLPYRSRIEFLVIAFEDQPEILPWLRQNFASQMADGYLRTIALPSLPVWHFGQAKNRFRPYLSGRLYSSLDADNFVTDDETELLLDLFDHEGATFMVHHFSGTWGDGSSGRLTMPRWAYRQVGYDEDLMPRQFDEVDAILSTLVRFPGLTLCHYNTENTVLDTDNIRAFLRGVGLKPHMRRLPTPDRRPAANPRPATYVTDDPKIAAMQSINEGLCFLKHLVDYGERERWLQRLQQDVDRLVEETDPDSALSLIFAPKLLGLLDTMIRAHHHAAGANSRVSHLP